MAENFDLSKINTFIKDRVNILVAEDDNINQRIATLILKKIGLESTIAVDGLDVLKKMEEHTYDIIFMDYQMPNLNGIETTKRVFENCDASNRPYVIAMTANVASQHLDKYKEVGMSDIVKKPYTIDSVITVLNTYIENKFQ